MRYTRTVWIAGSILACTVSATAHAIDWQAVPGTEIILLYPAQLSWEWVTNDDDHSGAKKIADGRTCRSCHDRKETESGALLVDYKPTEPAVIAGKPGSIVATVKAAHDGQKLFLQLQFDTRGQPDAGQDKTFSDKVAVMIDDGGVEEAKRVGCWAACHDDANTMRHGKPAMTKYLTNAGANGRFLEYWQARLAKGKDLRVIDGTVAAARSENGTPLVKGAASFTDGVWTVEFSRDLKAGQNRKSFAAGQTYTLGFAIHAGHTAHRFHYVSLEKTLAVDNGTADFVARPQ
jgi:cytochrome c-type protein NapC